MARPMKNNCDYFPHDADMRNHKKIRALRSAFGIQAYALWCMVLEYLTSRDYGLMIYNDLEVELLAGDFGVQAEELDRVIQYCLKLGLIQKEGEMIRSESLNERLAPVFEKRGNVRQKRTFVQNDEAETPVNVIDNPQRKGKERKEEETEGNEIINPFRDSVEFGQAWTDWELYRKQKRSKLTDMSVRHQMKFLSQYGVDEAVQIIRQSIQNGWVGLFELKNRNNGKRTFKDSANIINNYFEGGNS